MADDRLTEIAARVAALNGNSLPGGTWTASPRNELSILPPEMAHVVEDVLRTEKGAVVRSSVGVFGDEAHAAFAAHAPEDVSWLLVEVARLRAELEKYVGKEPTRDEEAQYVSRCLDAVYDACEAARRDGRVLTVEEIEQAADGNRPDSPDDKRRRIYLDGEGHAWISHCTDPANGELIARLDSNPFHDGEPVQEVREHTGSLREIGRTW